MKKAKTTIPNKRAFMLTVMLMLLTVLLSAAVSGADASKNEITSVTLAKNKADIVLEIALQKEYVKEHKSEELYVFEFLPYQSTSELNTLTPIADFKCAEKAKVTVDFISGNSNRLYSKFLVAEKAEDGTYSILTAAKYIENLESLATNTEAFPVPASKKGLQVQLFTDAQLLGVQHTTINVELNEYILGENSDKAQSFVYNGQTFYLNKDKLALLDHRVKTYSEAGINVYLNILLTKPAEDANAVIRSFYYDNASPDAIYYALNTRSATAMQNFLAFMDYILERYTRPDHEYGFVPGIILGFEVNASRAWNNAGPMEMQNYIYSYCTAFRISYMAMRSHYSEGRVYLSVGNNFTSAAPDAASQGSEDVLFDYPAKGFIEVFAGAIANSGDIEWGLSINPYPSDEGMTDYWNDTLAKDDEDTPFITMKNIDILCRFLRREEFLYDGQTRSILVGEFGLNGDPREESSMTMQAAAYALAYYTAAQNEDIDAFIYHRQVDYAGEGYYYGLWSSVEDSPLTPSAKKSIYNVFSLIDTDQSAEATAFVKATVGNGAFSRFMGDKVKYSEFETRRVMESGKVDASETSKGYKTRTLFNLKGGSLCGFYPSDGAGYVELKTLDNAEESILYARITDAPTDYRGISNASLEPEAFENAHYVTLKLMTVAPAEVPSVDVMIRLQSEGNADREEWVYEGEVSLRTNEWHEVTFKVKDFIAETDGNVDLLKLWIKADDGARVDGEYGIWLESVVLHTKGGTSFLAVILWALLILVLLAVIGYAALYIRAQMIRKKRREMRRRQMLAMQQTQQTQQMPRRPMPGTNPGQPGGTIPPQNRPPYNNNPRM